MEHDNRRITLISRSKSAPERQWITSRSASRHVIFVESFGVIPFALTRGIEEMGKDVECVIIDGSATAAEYLHLLSTLPPAYAGDVLLIENDIAFVSATGRGGDRVLYALRPEDVQFYLETKMLTAAAESVAA
jgi:hypothetical protein